MDSQQPQDLAHADDRVAINDLANRVEDMELSDDASALVLAVGDLDLADEATAIALANNAPAYDSDDSVGAFLKSMERPAREEPLSTRLAFQSINVEKTTWKNNVLWQPCGTLFKTSLTWSWGSFQHNFEALAFSVCETCVSSIELSNANQDCIG